ncbi:MAG: YebC/PmpR family DNA-binding transcriptional regulator [Chloroherpetonaceae bacterium]|nr:YebC/PmpR family DNA-binding transcriptional regulator [Chloroherpetonaceae bacterium]
MGRIFEKRKDKMFARWAKMSKAFTKIGREISMAVKAGGTNPDSNLRLRRAIQNAKSVNMPKDRVENAIKKAASKEDGDFQELIYEGYGPHGIAILVETATDNPTRTVANVRMHFNKHKGSLGTGGSVAFMFERKGIFKLAAPQGADLEALELELIDFGAEEFSVEDNDILIYTTFADFSTMQKHLEEKGLHPQLSVLQYLPTNSTDVSEAVELEVQSLIDALEDDDDVQAVYHNMK